jgi:polyisoprenoid-binding protein YceI
MIAGGCFLRLAQPAVADTLHLEADPKQSEITATVEEPFGIVRDHPTATGAFTINSCEIDGDQNNPGATGHVKLELDATSYDSGSSTRDRNVIHSALETANYQTIEFESTGLEDVQVDVPRVSGSATVVGRLTLHGTTKTIRVPVRLSLSTDGQFTASGEFEFRYTDFGISAPRLGFLIPVSDRVTVTFRIVAQVPGSPAAQPTS